MICYSLQVATKKIGLGKVTKYSENYFISEKGIFCTVFDFKQIIRLQEIYGTGAVNYCPFPTIICQKENMHSDRVSIFNRSGNTDTDKALRAAKTLNMEVKMVNTSTMNAGSILDCISQSSMIIINGEVRTNILYMIFASAIPFMLIGCSNLQIRNLCDQCGLKELFSRHDEKKSILEIWKNREIISHTLIDATKRLNSFISWAPHCKSFIDESYNDNEIQRIYDDDFKFTFSVGDYTGAFYKDFAEQLYDYTTTGGINLRLTTIRDFCKSNICILHPWIGIVESFDPQDVRKMLCKKEFQVSMSMCIGLYVYTQEIYDMIPENVTVTLIDFHLFENQERVFSFEEWKDQRVAVNMVNQSEFISLNGIDDVDTDDFICCLKSVSVKHALMIADAASKRIPIVLPQCDISKKILGTNYPLYSENSNPHHITNWITDEIIEDTLSYYDELLKTPIDTILMLSNTIIGKKAINLFK